MARSRPALADFHVVALVFGIVFASVAPLSTAAAQVSGLPQVPGFTTPQTVPASPLYENNGPVGVLERPRPEVEPQGLVVEGLRVFPSLSETSTFNTNVFATSTGAQSDNVFRTRPEITVDNATQPSLTTFAFDLYGEDDRYVANDRLSNQNFGTSLGLGAEFSPDLRGASRTSFSYQHQDPSTLATGTPNSSFNSLPLLTTFSQNLGLDRHVGPTDLSIDGTFTRDDYQNIRFSNGTLVNQTQLNGNTYQVGPKFGYDMAPSLRPYVQGLYTRYAYDNGLFDGNEYSLVAGTDFIPRRLFRGTAFVGYKERDYDSTLIPSASGFTYGINLTWFATEVLTVNALGAQNFYDSTATSVTGVHSTVNARSAALGADFEALRNLILSGVAGYENDDYLSTTRTDDVYSAGIGARYLLNRNWAVLAQYQYSNRQSSASGFSYDQQLISVALKFSY